MKKWLIKKLGLDKTKEIESLQKELSKLALAYMNEKNFNLELRNQLKNVKEELHKAREKIAFNDTKK